MDAAFEEAVTVYLAAGDEQQPSASANILSFLAVHASEKALENVHPKLTRRVHNLIYKARGEEDKVEVEPKKPEREEETGDAQAQNVMANEKLTTET